MNPNPATIRFSAPAPVLASLMAVALQLAAAPLRGEDIRPADLGQLIDRADKLVVLEAPEPGAKVHFESAERRDLDALKSASQVAPPEQFVHCMCDGTPAIELYAKGEKIGWITNHHANLIRCSLWRSDAPLLDAERFLKWFDDRKIPEPREEYERGLKLEKEANEAERKWLEAIPPSLKPHWASVSQAFTPDLAPLRKALNTQVLDKNERILALLAWYGSGEGPWSPCPSYEEIAATLLLDYQTPELLAAIDGKELSPAQMEGMARLFADWAYWHERSNDLKSLPPQLRAQLRNHVLSSESADEDKRARARSAFGAPERDSTPFPSQISLGLFALGIVGIIGLAIVVRYWRSHRGRPVQQ